MLAPRPRRFLPLKKHKMIFRVRHCRQISGRMSPKMTELYPIPSFSKEKAPCRGSFLTRRQRYSRLFPYRCCRSILISAPAGRNFLVISLAARFWDVNRGAVRLGGVDVRDMKSDEVLSRISVVFQDVYLFHDTVEGNIRMGKPDATQEEIIAAAKAAACHDFIMALPDGYQTMVGEGGSTLSGGEKQRISIARALLKDAPIVLLDEATASLDPENEVLIQQAISALVAEKTVIVIAHRLQSIMSADNIVVLDEGQVAEQGTHEELLKRNGIYARLWAEQSQAGEWRLQMISGAP